MLTAYNPLAAVYDFHATAENWVLRLYTPQVAVTDGAERRRVAWAENVVAIFPERRPSSTTQTIAGQDAPEQCTVYTRTPLPQTDTTNPQPSAVLFDPRGGAWQVTSDGRWDEALGYAATLTRAGRRGQAPWL